jgi:ankyrin repeat protein
MKDRITAFLKAAIHAAAALALASSACSMRPAPKLNPPPPNANHMIGYRLSMPPGGGWKATQDQESGGVVFFKTWSGFLRYLVDEQRSIEIRVTPIRVPFGRWSMTDEALASSIMNEYAEESSDAGGEADWQLLVCGKGKLHYLREEKIIDGDAQSTGLRCLMDDVEYLMNCDGGLYFPTDLAKTHRYFEIFLTFRYIDDSGPRLSANPERPLLQAIVDSIETVPPFAEIPGLTGDLLRAAVGGNSEAALKALNAGADIDAVLPLWTPLDVAAYYGRRGIVDLLVLEGSDIDEVEGRPGLTPLLAALLADHPEIATLLLEKGADATKCSEEGFSPLMIAAALEYPELVSMLVGKGAAVNGRSGDGKTPLMFAAQSGAHGAAGILLKSGADVNLRADDSGTALIRAIDWNCGQVARLLVDSGADIGIRDDEGWSALLAAIWQGDPALAEDLIRRGADVNVSVEETGRTVLMLALEADEDEIARKLIESGADVNRRKDGDWTPLMMATAKGRSELVLLMIRKGANVNAESADHLTALAIAEKNSLAPLAEVLIKAGAKK